MMNIRNIYDLTVYLIVYERVCKLSRLVRRYSRASFTLLLVMPTITRRRQGVLVVVSMLDSKNERNENFLLYLQFLDYACEMDRRRNNRRERKRETKLYTVDNQIKNQTKKSARERERERERSQRRGKKINHEK